MQRTSSACRRRPDGVVLALLGTHMLLDWGFYRGAFILAPAAMALGLLPIALIWGLDAGGKRALKQASVVLGVIALLVITPALPAAMNLMPTPPRRLHKGTAPSRAVPHRNHDPVL